MKRSDIYALIDKERDYQDATFDPSEIRAGGITRAQEHATAPPHIVLLESYAAKMRQDWTFGYRQYNDSGRLAVFQSIAKSAAIAIRALEEMEGSDQLLTDGLR